MNVIMMRLLIYIEQQPFQGRLVMVGYFFLTVFGGVLSSSPGFSFAGS